MAFLEYQSKKIYYEVIGNGEPLIMLHGDTASSKMFEMLIPMYQQYFEVILIDFLGNGRSDRIERFPANLWVTQADQIIALIEHLQLNEVNLLGTSGGAWVAINTALKRPDLVNKVIADSFDGRTLHNNFINDLTQEREFAKHDAFAKQFYEWCQGNDWENVVNLNTQALVECAKKQIPLFCRPLETLKTPILLIGSLEDDMCRKDIQAEYEAIKKMVFDASIYLFKTGKHPAIASNAEKFFDIVKSYIYS